MHCALSASSADSGFSFCRFGLLVLLVVVFSFGGTGVAAEPPNVVVSIKPIHSLVAQLMAGVAEPTLLVDGVATPYDYQLSPEQQKEIARARLVIWVGEELEPFLSKALAGVEDERVMELLASDLLKILPTTYDEKRRDPFFWLDSRNALILLDEVAHKLVALDPERADRYKRNHRKAVQAISEIDRQLEYRYRDVSAAPIALYHGTQQYFEQAYAASTVAIVSPQPGTTPSTEALLRVRSRLVDRGAVCLLTEAGLASPSLGLLTRESVVEVAELDSFGTRLEPGPELYRKMILANFDTIHDCIGGSGATTETQQAGHRIFESENVVPGKLSGRFMLVDHNGRTTTNADFLGMFQLIAFGYTSCPDVCPTSLVLMNAAMQRLGEQAELIQPLFISVDPERDTPEVLSEYASFFQPRLIGLTGPKKMIDYTVRDFGARYEKVPSGDGDYAMNHTAGFYLFDPEGVFLTKFAHGLTADRLAEKLRAYMR